MTIIDLLEKIANGELVPNKIIFREVEWSFNPYAYDYKQNDGDIYLFENLFTYEMARTFLNEPVEIIGDEKR
jgi:hypothetical protein